jgi:4-amino-4-deoxy-L-arabinose transferase-like glycosyltransferase
MVDRGKRIRLVVAGLALAVTAVGVLRVWSTLSVFSATIDEPDHIGAGMEWLSRGTYTRDTKHTPLGRVAAAFPLWLDGSRSVGLADEWDEGNAIFASRGRFQADLAKARSGIVVFFVLMCGVVFLWSMELFGPWIGLLCLFELSLLPAVLALSGLVTTDMAGASTVVLSLWMFLRWSRRRTPWRALAAGFCLGLALLAKLSAVPLLVGCALVWLAFQAWMRRGWPSEAVRFRLGQTLLVGLGAFLLIWAGYRFQSEPLSQAKTVRRYQARLDQHSLPGRAISKALDVPIPGGNMIRGFGDLLIFEGEPTRPQYFLGKVKAGGWLLYFPVAFLVKAPLPFLILCGIGLLLAIRVVARGGDVEWCYPAGFALVVFLVCLPTHWNIGTRYLLAAYPLLCIASGLAIRSLWHSPRLTAAARAVVAGLLFWLAAESAYAHPDYLAYFNELAGGHPERILADSDLDWGQDLYRLQREARRVHASPLWEAYWGMTRPQAYGFDTRALPADRTVSGWVAVSIQLLVLTPERYAWLAPYSWRPVGKSIRFYFVPEPAPAPLAPVGREQALSMLHLK